MANGFEDIAAWAVNDSIDSLFCISMAKILCIYDIIHEKWSKVPKRD